MRYFENLWHVSHTSFRTKFVHINGCYSLNGCSYLSLSFLNIMLIEVLGKKKEVIFLS